MRRLLTISAGVALLVVSLFPGSASAIPKFDPAPTATFDTPQTPPSGSTQATRGVTLTITVTPGADPNIIGSQVEVRPVAYNAPGFNESAEYLGSQNVTFTSASDSRTLTFNTNLIYDGANYIGVYFHRTDGTYDGYAGGQDPATTTRHLINYTGNTLPIYRFLSPRFNNAHFYTLSDDEKTNLRTNDVFPAGNWTYEGIAFNATKVGAGETCTGQSQAFRFYSPRFKTHFYTISTIERDRLVNDDNFANGGNWTYENVAYCADAAESIGNNTALYRFFSPRFRNHFFTTSTAERDQLINNDNFDTQPNGNWRQEGTAYYVLPYVQP